MNALIENNHITELMCGSNITYILSDNSTFLKTEYKVLQSQANSCFVKCMKMTYNGNIQLYYITKSLKPMSAMVSSLDADSFLTIVTNLLSDIIDVKHNGFLSCQNIDISFDRIYVDPATYKVSLVYLPLSKRIYDDAQSFENEIRTGLIKLISGTHSLYSEKTENLTAQLSDGTLTIEDLYGRVIKVSQAAPSAPKAEKEPEAAPEVKEDPIAPIPPINDQPRKSTGAMSAYGMPSGAAHQHRGGPHHQRGGGQQSAGGVAHRARNPYATSVMRIVAMNAPARVELTVNKDEYVIGKKAELCDGVIGFNNMISRAHCRVSRRQNQFFITDLQSANGTFVNRVRLQPGRPHPLKNGDIVRLANSDFQVVIMTKEG